MTVTSLEKSCGRIAYIRSMTDGMKKTRVPSKWCKQCLWYWRVVIAVLNMTLTAIQKTPFIKTLGERNYGRNHYVRQHNKKALKSLKKHQSFYEVMFALVRTMKTLFGAALIYDMHSYNRKRWERLFR